jgi:hypothetical protein
MYTTIGYHYFFLDDRLLSWLDWNQPGQQEMKQAKKYLRCVLILERLLFFLL